MVINNDNNSNDNDNDKHINHISNNTDIHWGLVGGVAHQVIIILNVIQL